MKRACFFPSHVAIPIAFMIAIVASGQTRAYLDAPIVKADIPVQWNASGKALQWLSHGQPTEFTSETLFLSKGPVNITYPRMNPLRVRATASATAVADPSAAILSKLVDAITSVVTTVAPVLAPATSDSDKGHIQAAMAAFTQNKKPTFADCTDPGSATLNLTILWHALYDPIDPKESMGMKVSKWIGTIDKDLATGSGDVAVGHAAQQIGEDLAQLSERLNSISNTLSVIHGCAELGVQKGPTARNPDENRYIDADLNPNSAFVEKLTALKAAMAQLQSELTNTYAVSANWVGPERKDFRLNATAIVPTLEQMQNVTVKITSLELKSDASTNALTMNMQDSSTAFTIRRYSLLVPEIGTGAVFGTIKKPTYGTGKNAAGETIVTRAADTSISVNPSLMVNFVCHCSAGALAPMFQMGSSASKDLPALLVGGGLRLFGLRKGDISIGGGAMFAWVKDLQKLKPGDVVTGMTDINADLGYSARPKLGGYFAIIYKF